MMHFASRQGVSDQFITDLPVALNAIQAVFINAFKKSLPPGI